MTCVDFGHICVLGDAPYGTRRIPRGFLLDSVDLLANLTLVLEVSVVDNRFYRLSGQAFQPSPSFLHAVVGLAVLICFAHCIRFAIRSDDYGLQQRVSYCNNLFHNVLPTQCDQNLGSAAKALGQGLTLLQLRITH